MRGIKSFPCSAGGTTKRREPPLDFQTAAFCVMRVTDGRPANIPANPALAVSCALHTPPLVCVRFNSLTNPPCAESCTCSNAWVLGPWSSKCPTAHRPEQEATPPNYRNSRNRVLALLPPPSRCKLTVSRSHGAALCCRRRRHCCVGPCVCSRDPVDSCSLFASAAMLVRASADGGVR